MAEKHTETGIAGVIKKRLRNRKIENIPEHLNKLEKAKSMLEKEHEFNPGDYVVWKTGLQNRLRPAVSEPAIVLQVLDEPIKDMEEQNSGSSGFNEPLDLVLGIINEDEDFMIYYYDKRRFEPYQE